MALSSTSNCYFLRPLTLEPYKLYDRPYDIIFNRTTLLSVKKCFIFYNKLVVKPALCAYVSLKREKKMEGGEGNVGKSRNFRCIIRCRNPLLCLIESGKSGEESG